MIIVVGAKVPREKKKSDWEISLNNAKAAIRRKINMSMYRLERIVYMSEGENQMKTAWSGRAATWIAGILSGSAALRYFFFTLLLY